MPMRNGVDDWGCGVEERRLVWQRPKLVRVSLCTYSTGGLGFMRDQRSRRTV